ncbi:MAG: class I SAM-dependent methyltransferase [Inquilinaceae bacterium]
MFADPPLRAHTDVLETLVPVAGREGIDIGCGSGDLVRALTLRGARMVGVECSDAALARAWAADPAGDEIYLFGTAEDLPINDAATDLAIFFRSLHHVSVDRQDDALIAAARALRPGGRVYIAEPVAVGAHGALMTLVDDETSVRAAAQAAIGRAAAGPLTLLAETRYRTQTRYDGFDAFRRSLIDVDPRRAVIIDGLTDLERRFHDAARPGPDGFVLEETTRVAVLGKPG